MALLERTSCKRRALRWKVSKYKRMLRPCLDFDARDQREALPTLFERITCVVNTAALIEIVQHLQTSTQAFAFELAGDRKPSLADQTRPYR